MEYETLLEHLEHLKSTFEVISVYDLDVRSMSELYYTLVSKINLLIEEIIAFEEAVIKELDKDK